VCLFCCDEISWPKKAAGPSKLAGRFSFFTGTGLPGWKLEVCAKLSEALRGFLLFLKLLSASPMNSFMSIDEFLLLLRAMKKVISFVKGWQQLTS